MVNLEKIAKEIHELDFSDVPDDKFNEGCYLVARNVFDLSEEEADEVVEIIQKEFYN